jgi:hypothetical protein
LSEERRLVCVPSDDASFVEAVEAVVSRLDRPEISDEDLVAAVIGALRVRYPAVRMRSRDPIADYLPDRVTWYVYRDGGGEGPPRKGPSSR